MTATQAPARTLPPPPPSFAVLAGRALEEQVETAVPAGLATGAWHLGAAAYGYVLARLERPDEPAAAPPLAPPEHFHAAPHGWGASAACLRMAMRSNDLETAAFAADCLSRSAERAGLLRTAAVFAETAAVAAPLDARRALRVATLARDRADHLASEWWGTRAANLARRVEDWRTAVHAWARVADSWHDRGQYQRALLARKREIRAARQGCLRTLAARALHSSVGAYWLVGDRSGARKAATHALRVYHPADPQLIVLAHDVAVMLLEEGEAAASLPVFAAVLPRIIKPRERLTATVNLARASVAVRDRDGFEYAVSQVLESLNATFYGDGAAWALSELARAAAEGRGDFTRGRLWAKQSLHLAEQRGEQLPAETARHVLSMVGG